MSLQSDLDGERYDDVIVGVREWVAADPSAAFADATTKRWMSLRWKDLFLREAVQDDAALATAGKRVSLANPLAPRLGKDTRSDRQKIADRFLKDVAAPDWQIELPDPDVTIENATLVLCPGLLSGILHPGAHAFVEDAPVIEEERGWKTLRADLEYS